MTLVPVPPAWKNTKKNVQEECNMWLQLNDTHEAIRSHVDFVKVTAGFSPLAGVKGEALDGNFWSIVHRSDL